MFGDSFFKKVEKKTNVDKNTILSLAKKLQNSNNMKDEKVLRDMVQEISALTGRTVEKEREDKIVNAIMKDNVPKDIDKMF
ncbi:MAG: stage VI sporulation protein F [Bacilli bacterium]|nr:stage VI sporulation protein F [Bacilli bacterium]